MTISIISLIISGTSAILFPFLLFWVKKSISSKYELNIKRLERDFTLYTEKKHSAYIEIYELLLIAESNTESLWGLKTVPTFQEYNESDMIEYMQLWQIKRGEIDRIIDIWKSDKTNAIKELSNYTQMLKYQNCKGSIDQLKSKYWQSILYLSDELSQKLDLIIKDLYDIFHFRNSSYELHLRHSKEEKENHSKVVEHKNIIFNEILSQMKSELSIGYYK